MLKMTGTNLELITGIDMVEKGLRGGVIYIFKATLVIMIKIKKTLI